MSRYTKQHYEDVARLLAGNRDATGLVRERNGAIGDLANDFADLFAADNPPTCIDCGARRGETDPNSDPGAHLYEHHFDRERFLAACGLETGG